MTSPLLKITFIHGLKDIVLKEINQYPELRMAKSSDEEIYLDIISDFKIIQHMRSVVNIYIVKRSKELNPFFISNHKSILGEMIGEVIQKSGNIFRTFKLSCAGSNSKEVQEIHKFISTTYKLIPGEDADLELYIGKSDDVWEIGVRVNNRPLSLRDYKIENIKGGLNPTIAYAINTFCDLNSIQSYMNIFSGSGTLLIEAGLSNPNLTLVGFDINGKSNALAVQNIKKAKLIKSIHLKTADIFNNPDLGTFDCITSDLPFGMQISKNEDLEKLYRSFVDYSKKKLNPQGKLVTYTTEHELLNSILLESKFTIIKQLDLKVSTSVNSYIYPKIFVCELK